MYFRMLVFGMWAKVVLYFVWKFPARLSNLQSACPQKSCQKLISRKSLWIPDLFRILIERWFKFGFSFSCMVVHRGNLRVQSSFCGKKANLNSCIYFSLFLELELFFPTVRRKQISSQNVIRTFYRNFLKRKRFLKIF